MGLFPEHKAALTRLEHVMENPDDNEEYKLEYQVFSSYEQELEKHQACKQSRAEWDEKSRVYENYKAEQAEEKVILPEDEWTLPMNSQKTRYHSY